MLQFSLDNLKELDAGKAQIAFDHHVRRAALDCMDRPGDKKARVVALQVTLTPVMEPGGDCTEVEVQIQATSKVPTHKTKAYSMGLRRNGVVVFNPDSPDAVDQATMFEDEED